MSPCKPLLSAKIQLYIHFLNLVTLWSLYNFTWTLLKGIFKTDIIFELLFMFRMKNCPALGKLAQELDFSTLFSSDIQRPVRYTTKPNSWYENGKIQNSTTTINSRYEAIFTFSCPHEKPSALEIREEQLNSVAEIAPKSLFSFVIRSPILFVRRKTYPVSVVWT